MSQASDDQERIGRVEDAVNTYSRPSELKITDLRLAVVASNYDYPIIRIDTNQGVYGIGEVSDAGHKEDALRFKSFLLGQNPCNVDMIFRAIKHFGNWGREGGGVSGIEIALWDLIGKVYGVPCYQFLGGKYRDKVRLYADTPAPAVATLEGYAQRINERKTLGLTFIKFDIGGFCLTPRNGAFGHITAASAVVAASRPSTRVPATSRNAWNCGHREAWFAYGLAHHGMTSHKRGRLKVMIIRMGCSMGQVVETCWWRTFGTLRRYSYKVDWCRRPGGRIAMTRGVFYDSHQNAANAHTRVRLAKIRAVVSSMRIGMAVLLHPQPLRLRAHGAVLTT